MGRARDVIHDCALPEDPDMHTPLSLTIKRNIKSESRSNAKGMRSDQAQTSRARRDGKV